VKRALKPRATSTLSVAAVTVTDRTCAHVLGLEPRCFRSLVSSRKVPHAVVGRRIVARIDDVLAALGLTDIGLGDEAGDEKEATPAPLVRGADRLLGKLGLERRGAT
jgi:hypothetical protein